MCGIVGRFGPAGSRAGVAAESPTLCVIAARIATGSGGIRVGGIGIGHTRFAHPDPSAAGEQPMASSGRSLSLRFQRRDL